jgi:predicted CoA-binding protein
MNDSCDVEHAVTDQTEFLTQMRSLAFYGLSATGKGFAYDVLKAITTANLQLAVWPVHPSASMLGGMKAQPSATRLKPVPDSALIVLKAPEAAQALEDAAAAGVKSVWLAYNAASKANLEHARSLGLKVTQGCPMLFMEGQGFPHNFHSALARMFKRI